MLCFIGSTLGNLQPYECEQFVGRIRRTLQPKEYFLLGIDLQKETSILEAAYNDAQGVTAAFNLNMLRRLNQRFEGDFNPYHFAHIATYNTQQQQIEMYLKSLRAQTVHFKALNFSADFESGELLLSEISRKFDLGSISEILNKHQRVQLKVSVKPDELGSSEKSLEQES